MTIQTQEDQDQVVYPETDGKPMAENTLQYEWITTIKGNLDILFRDDPNVFIAGDLFWYPVRGRTDIVVAPDVLVVFGRPAGHRRSYRQWREDGVAPQVVFEILSPSNRQEAMEQKFEFYDRYGVEEYYIYDPDSGELFGWRRVEGRLRPVAAINGWTSPRLGVRFDLSGADLVIYRPDGRRFLTELERDQETREAVRRAEEAKHRAEEEHRRAEEAKRRAEEEHRRAEEAKRRAEEEHRRAEEESRRADEERREREQANMRAERMAAMLRALGVDPDKPPE